jgi:hypothetical protein
MSDGSNKQRLELYVSSISSSHAIRSAHETARRCLRGLDVVEHDIASSVPSLLVARRADRRSAMKKPSGSGRGKAPVRATCRSFSSTAPDQA